MAGSRSKARKRALDILYAGELRNETPSASLDRWIQEGEPLSNPYTVELVKGVAEHLQEIDREIREAAEGWTLERMPVVDRNVLRLGVYELLWAEDVPDGVAVSEALALVQELSTDDSPSFVNGVLGAIQRSKAGKPTP
ncbi:transcription antitermination factor NusB [Nocardioides daejeonensis]|uniref:transcription antitermination factor NusB n=1 Tax=Nocardioides daejeonensis TaxID=1046556 RepID=UPI000D742027|nr:transcription antitermination factor NusB [Nocardioides daejeonensis]